MTMSDMKEKSKEMIDQLRLRFGSALAWLKNSLSGPKDSTRPQFLSLLNLFGQGGAGEMEFEDEVLLIEEEGSQDSGEDPAEGQSISYSWNVEGDGRRRYHYGYRSFRTGKAASQDQESAEMPITPWSQIQKEQFLKRP